MLRRARMCDIIAAGEFCWHVSDGKRKLIVAIPINAALKWVLSDWTIDHQNMWGAQWHWDENEDAPTLHPSLHALGVWHGHVRAGYLVEAAAK